VFVYIYTTSIKDGGGNVLEMRLQHVDILWTSQFMCLTTWAFRNLLWCRYAAFL